MSRHQHRNKRSVRGEQGSAARFCAQGPAEFWKHPTTISAFKWGSKGSSIAGAKRPFNYLGELMVDLAELFKHQLNIEEMKLLVRPDGPAKVCFVTGETFQPVQYITHVSDDLVADVAGGKALKDCRIPYGGNFYVIPEGVGGADIVAAVSGSPFYFDYRQRRFQLAYNGELVKFAREKAADLGMIGKHVWGMTLEQAVRTLQANGKSGCGDPACLYHQGRLNSGLGDEICEQEKMFASARQ